MKANELIVGLTMIGLFGVLALATLRWHKLIFRVLPFFYATVTSVVFLRNKRIRDLLLGVLVMNAAVGIALFAVWLDAIRGGENKGHGKT